MPVVNRLDLSAYPDNPLEVVDIREHPSTCIGGGSGRSGKLGPVCKADDPGSTTPVAATEMNKVVSLVKADTSGRQADQVYFGPDHANFVVVTGNKLGAQTSGNTVGWWVTDAGARFGVEDSKQRRTCWG
ncbi:type VII secretion protein EccB [Mycobacterium tuberculosis]